MKKFLLVLLILLPAKAFSQTDSSYKTEDIFYISFINYDKDEKELKDVRLTDIDSVSLSYEEVIMGQNSNQNKYIAHTIIFDKINSFGYRVSASIGSRIGYGSLTGFIIGGVLGGLSGGYSPGGSGNTDNQRPAFIVIGGFLFAIPGALIGAATGIGQKQFEIVNVSKYERAKKFEIIKRLIKNGVKENE